MEIVILWIGLSVVAGVVAAQKGRSGAGYFFLALLLSPLIGLLLALVIAPAKGAVDRRALGYDDLKKCPQCAEMIRAEAIKCRYCGSDLAAATEDQSDTAVRALAERLAKVQAPHHGKVIMTIETPREVASKAGDKPIPGMEKQYRRDG